MKVVSIQGADVGGAAWRWENLLRRYLGWEVVRFQGAALKLGFPPGIIEREEPPVIEAIETADLVHVHTAHMLGHWAIRMEQYGVKKPLCGTAHGIESLGIRSKVARERNLPLVYVTPNLSSTFPNGTFIPNSVDPEAEGVVPARFRKECAGVPVLACSRSYVAGVKNYRERDKFVLATRVSKRFPDQFIPNRRWLEEFVYPSNFVWDHLQGYWGQTTVEGFALRTIPVVTPDANARRMAAEFFGKEPPFGPKNLDGWISLAKSYAQSSPEERRAAADERFAFYRDYWHPSKIAHHWKNFYETKVLV